MAYPNKKVEYSYFFKMDLMLANSPANQYKVIALGDFSHKRDLHLASIWEKLSPLLQGRSTDTEIKYLKSFLQKAKIEKCVPKQTKPEFFIQRGRFR